MNMRPMLSPKSKTRTRGSAIMEFSLMLPFVLLLFFGIVEFTRFMQAFLTVQHAAREGARYAITGRSVTGEVADRPQSIVFKTRAAAAGLRIEDRVDGVAQEDYSTTPNDLDVWVNPIGGGAASGLITVTVTYNFSPLVPVVINVVGQQISIVPNLLTVTGQAVMLNERLDYITPLAEGTLPGMTAGPTATLPGGTPATATATLVGGPTITPTATLEPPTATFTPSITPAACDFSNTALAVGGGGGGGMDDKVEFNITNNMTTDAIITSVYVQWPAVNANFHELKFGGAKIWEVEDTSPPTLVNSDWSGSVGDRTLSASGTEKLEVKFTNKPIPDSYYKVTVTFDNGCEVTDTLGTFATDTPKPTPTVPGAATSTPTAAACNFSNTALAVGGGMDDKVEMTITNNMAAAAEVVSVYVEWPAVNANLHEMKLGGDKIWEVEDTSPPTFVNSGWTGSAADRTIQSGDGDKLEVKFTNKPIPENYYLVTVTFDNGCEVTDTLGSPPTVTPTPTDTVPVTPTPTQDPSCMLTSTQLAVAGGRDDKIEFHITNNGGTDVEIISVYVEWPAVNDNMKEIKFGGTKIYDTDDPTPPTLVTSGWSGTVADRTLGSGATEKMEVKFTNDPIPASTYLVTVTFDNSCYVSDALP